MAGPALDGAYGCPLGRKNPHRRSRGSTQPQRRPLLPRIQVHFRRLGTRLSHAPTDRSGSRPDADHLRPSRYDCPQLRDERSVALQSLVPPNCGRNTAPVASYAARGARGSGHASKAGVFLSLPTGDLVIEQLEQTRGRSVDACVCRRHSAQPTAPPEPQGHQQLPGLRLQASCVRSYRGCERKSQSPR